MDDGELEQARKRKLEEIQRAREAEEQIKSTLRVILDETAYGRMANVKLSSPELYAKAVQGCMGVYQRLGRRLTEKEVLFVLRRMKGEEKETHITFERK